MRAVTATWGLRRLCSSAHTTGGRLTILTIGRSLTSCPTKSNIAATKAPPERRRQAKLPAPQPENILRELRRIARSVIQNAGITGRIQTPEESPWKHSKNSCATKWRHLCRSARHSDMASALPARPRCHRRVGSFRRSLPTFGRSPGRCRSMCARIPICPWRL
jgi:hypothetical protein